MIRFWIIITVQNRNFVSNLLFQFKFEASFPTYHILPTRKVVSSLMLQFQFKASLKERELESHAKSRSLDFTLAPLCVWYLFRVLLKPLTTDPLTTDLPTHRPLTTYPSTHRPTIINLRWIRRPDSEHVLHSIILENFTYCII